MPVLRSWFDGNPLQMDAQLSPFSPIFDISNIKAGGTVPHTSQRDPSTHYDPLSGTEGKRGSLHVPKDSLKIVRTDLVEENTYNRRTA